MLVIGRILRGIGWTTIVPVFDPPYELLQYGIYQLVAGTKDGFYEDEKKIQDRAGQDPLKWEEPQLWQNTIDSPHWED